MIELIGSIAGFLTTISMVPQVIKVARTKKVDGLSGAYFLILFSGIILWIFYGYLKDSPSLVVANLISGGLVSFILYSIHKYGKK